MPGVTDMPRYPVLEFLAMWGRNASPFFIANLLIRMHWKGVNFWKDVAAAANKGKELIKYVDALEKGARALAKAANEQAAADQQLPQRPIKSGNEAKSFLVSEAELDYVKRYWSTAAVIANDALDCRTALQHAIWGWEYVLREAQKTRDFTRKAVWESILVLDLKFGGGGGFLRYLTNARDLANRVEQSARFKQHYAQHILGVGSTAEWFTPPAHN